jgi:hypothetical protein
MSDNAQDLGNTQFFTIGTETEVTVNSTLTMV